MRHLVLGGIRSGKSAFAESAISDYAGPYTYIATSQIWDEEMRRRIELHQERRGGEWRLVEAPIDLSAGVRQAQGPVLLDCLSMWVSNMLLANHDISAAKTELLTVIASYQDPLIMVSNEVGLGGISPNKLQREFTDALGSLNQAVAAISQRVTFVAAGLPVILKG